MSESSIIELRNPDEEEASLHLKRTCTTLFNENQFCDVTISCKDGQIQAHRMILCSASTYLYNLFTTTPWPTPCSHPVILLRNSRVSEVRTVMEFIYTGFTKTSKDKLQALMEVGRELECTSFLKSIESAVQSCGVAMFRKLISNNRITAPLTTTTNQKNKQEFDLTIPPVSLLKKSADQNEVKSVPSLPRASPIKASNTNGIAKKLEKRKTVKMRNGSMKITPSNATKNTNGFVQRQRNFLLTTVENSNHSNAKEQKKAAGESLLYRPNNDSIMDYSEHESSSEDRFNKGEDMQMSHPSVNNNDNDNNENDSIPTIPQFMLSTLTENGFSLRAPGQLEIKTEDSEEGMPASCPWCLQVFTSLPLLQRHIKTHVGIEKPKFVCDYCNTTFGRSAHLKRHLRTHTGEKPYLCGICQTRFARQDKLKIHLERHLQNASSNLNTNNSWTTNNSSMTITPSYQPPATITPSLTGGNHLPIKVLIPKNNIRKSTAHVNGDNAKNGHGSSSPSSIITSNSSLSSASPSPSLNGGTMRIDKVVKNLSPSTTITSVSHIGQTQGGH